MLNFQLNYPQTKKPNKNNGKSRQGRVSWHLKLLFEWLWPVFYLLILLIFYVSYRTQQPEESEQIEQPVAEESKLTEEEQKAKDEAGK